MTAKSLITSPLTNHSVHIIGLGWLGLPLAKHLLKKDMNVSGTTTSKKKQALLVDQGVDADMFQLQKPYLAQQADSQTLREKRFENANLVLNIPPGRQNFDKNIYVSQMKNLIDFAMQAGLKRLVFVSTTSVYGNQTGAVSNQSALSPNTESGFAHAQLERYLISNYANRIKILRPAGLIGRNIDASLRHPIYTLCHKKNIAKGRDPVNLVHQEDVIQVITTLLEAETKSASFNIAALEHPSRKDYYTWCAQQLTLPVPNFSDDTQERILGKRVDATDTYKELGITPKYASPFSMLES